jgi:hypothetical protein
MADTYKKAPLGSSGRASAYH